MPAQTNDPDPGHNESARDFQVRNYVWKSLREPISTKLVADEQRRRARARAENFATRMTSVGALTFVLGILKLYIDVAARGSVLSVAGAPDLAIAVLGILVGAFAAYVGTSAWRRRNGGGRETTELSLRVKRAYRQALEHSFLNPERD